MKVQKIEEEINQTENHLASLKNSLKEIQQNCDHHFKGNNKYNKCLKCNKVIALYY
ncbi:serine protease [Halobacillus shinanisalinarum]|uniref:Serine protease n=1 Tax=Halobacillus shinanisalinarum TaxID=2932258 RepID=A0ABY4GZ19_9BACI|nr:serine protease [Halobacillus shinanisalinarum]UOQ93153.1 serine protease [Halobacillus shinanisalinarum]